MVPQPFGRNLQTPSGVPPGFIGAGLFGVHTLFGESFNRGFTRYFLDGRTPDIFSFHTPKSLGEEVGTVKDIRGKCIVVSGVKPFANGDGLCFLDEQGNLQGFRVNRVEANKIYPAEMPRVRPHARLYRNFDKAFEDVLSRPSAVRKIRVEWTLGEYAEGFTLEVHDEDEPFSPLSVYGQTKAAGDIAVAGARATTSCAAPGSSARGTTSSRP